MLFSHSPTMYSVFVADCRKADLVPLTPMFAESLLRSLERSG